MGSSPDFYSVWIPVTCGHVFNIIGGDEQDAASCERQAVRVECQPGEVLVLHSSVLYSHSAAVLPVSGSHSQESTEPIMLWCLQYSSQPIVAFPGGPALAFGVPILSDVSSTKIRCVYKCVTCGVCAVYTVVAFS